jgi:hypothetical protein
MIVVLASCLQPYQKEGEKESGTPSGPMGAASELFKPIGDGAIRFYTADTKYRTPLGYTLWAYNEKPQETFKERTVVVNKPAGDSIAGYGVIICSGLREVGGRKERVFLAVMINNNGQYAVGKVTGASYKEIEGWKSTEGLGKSAGLDNTIKIVRDGGSLSSRYNLYFNGRHDPETDYFIDSMEPVCAGGDNGYIVVISPTDLSGGSGVEVWFYE